MQDSTGDHVEKPSFAVRVGMVLNAGLAVSLLMLWVQAAREGQFWRSDFSMFYTGWTMVLRQEGHLLYDLDAQLSYQREILPERGPDGGLLPFNYPPTTAVPLCVLARLPRSTAFYVWAAMQAGLVFLIIRQFLSLMSGYGGEDRVLMVATFLAFPAVFVSLQMGQMSLLVLACLTGMTLALERGQPMSAAVWFVVATIKPQLAVAAAVVLVAGRRWVVLLYAVGFWLPWAVLATHFTSTGAWLDWLAVVRKSAGEAGQLGIFPDKMYSLKCVLFGVLGAENMPLVNALSFAALTLAVAAIAALWRGPWPSDPATFRPRLALSLQLGLLTCPHLNPADASLYALPAILLAVARPSRWLVTLLVLCPAIFFLDCYSQIAWPFGLRPFIVAMAAVAAGVPGGRVSWRK